ncbi:MAG TPA: IS110 family transposase [Phycisphaerae bacterium]|nr:IS110 family transposase [Phycisphaerae bacterium]
MASVTMYAGLDYHQDSIQVCVMDPSARVRVNRACANELGAVVSMLKAAGEVGAIAMEACCGAADLAEELAAAGSWRVELAHAGYVAKLKGSPDKTDYSDARLLADLTRVGYLPRVWLAPRAIRDIRQLVNHRQRLVNQRRDLKLRVGACLREQRVKIDDAGRWSRRWVDRIKAHGSLSESVRWVIERMLEQIAVISGWVEQAEERLRQATEGHAVIGRLRKIEGIGEVTAWWLLGQVGRFDRFRNGKQLARYCGLSPRNRSSGSRQADGGLIEGCCEGLRAVLIQAAQRLVRTHERWKALAAKLRAKGKAKCVVIAAVANRWVRSLHHRMVAPAEQAGVVQE